MQWFKRLWPSHQSTEGGDALSTKIAELLQEIAVAAEGAISCTEQEKSYLCIDLEFSNLNSKKGDILSIGWVEIRDGKLLLSTSQLFHIKNRRPVGNSATIHEIRDQDAEQGLALKPVMLEFLESCIGKTLIFHHATLDMEYLNRACLSLGNGKLRTDIYDTMLEEQKRILKNVPVIPEGALTLANSRIRYGLPAYPNHDALVDAIATGELFLAQRSFQSQQ